MSIHQEGQACKQAAAATKAKPCIPSQPRKDMREDSKSFAAIFKNSGGTSTPSNTDIVSTGVQEVEVIEIDTGEDHEFRGELDKIIWKARPWLASTQPQLHLTFPSDWRVWSKDEVWEEVNSTWHSIVSYSSHDGPDNRLLERLRSNLADAQEFTMWLKCSLSALDKSYQELMCIKLVPHLQPFLDDEK